MDRALARLTGKSIVPGSDPDTSPVLWRWNVLIDAVPQLRDIAAVRGIQVASIGSQDMNDAVWIKLANTVVGLVGEAERLRFVAGSSVLRRLHLEAEDSARRRLPSLRGLPPSAACSDRIRTRA